MLKITIPDVHGWDSNNEEFIDIKGATLILEHSLVSLQKWEAKWNKPYLGKQEKTQEEVIDYIRCMTMTKASSEVDPRLYNYIPKETVEKIAAYINAPMTATTFSNLGSGNGPAGKEVITAEIVYYWMIKMGVPIEFRKWHLNQLMTLLKVCEIKEAPQKKMGRGDLNARNKALNAKRRAALHTHG